MTTYPMTIYSETRTGADGRAYRVRYLLTDEELQALTVARLLGNVRAVVDVAVVPELLIDAFQKTVAEAQGELH